MADDATGSPPPPTLHPEGDALLTASIRAELDKEAMQSSDADKMGSSSSATPPPYTSRSGRYPDTQELQGQPGASTPGLGAQNQLDCIQNFMSLFLQQQQKLEQQQHQMLLHQQQQEQQRLFQQQVLSSALPQGIPQVWNPMDCSALPQPAPVVTRSVDQTPLTAVPGTSSQAATPATPSLTDRTDPPVTTTTSTTHNDNGNETSVASDLNASCESDDGLDFWLVEDEEIIDHVVGNHSRQERLLMVAELLKMELRESPGTTKNFIKALGSRFETKKEDPSLPASSSLAEAFSAYTNELGARAGSTRAKRKNPNLRLEDRERDEAREYRDAYDVSSLPKFTRETGRPQLDRYPTVGAPWNTTPPAEHDHSLVKTSLFPGSSAPTLKCSLTQVKDWEGIARESLNVMSHLDLFLSASGTLFKDLFSDIINRRETNAADLFTHARMGINLNYAMAVAIQDLTKSLAWIVSDMTILRRDRWLQTFEKKIPRDILIDLRTGNVNGPSLFDPNLLEKAKEAAELQTEKKNRMDLHKATLESLRGVRSAIDSRGATNNNNKKFGKRPWNEKNQEHQQTDSKRPRQNNDNNNNNNNNNNNSYNTDRRPQRDSNNDKRPFQGNRGRGRGRGKFNKDNYRPRK